MRPSSVATVLAILFCADCLTGTDEWDTWKPYLGLPTKPMAVGAYRQVGLDRPPCLGSPKASICPKESLTEYLVFESDNPSVVELVDANTLLPTTDIQVPLALHALQPGSATLRAKARYSDGSEHGGSGQVTVRPVSKVGLDPVCADDRIGPFYIPCGADLTLHVVLFDGDQILDGYVPDLLEGEGLTGDSLFGPTPESFYWRPAGCPARSTVTSRMDPSFSALLATYGVGDVTGMQVTPEKTVYGTQKFFLYTPGTLPVDVSMVVGSTTTCQSLPPAARTETPSVCTGPSGEMQWASEGYQGGMLLCYILKEGTCKLTLGPADGALITVVSIPVFLAATSDRGDTFDPGGGCSTENEVTCSATRDATLLCANGHWVTATTCATDQMCDFLTAGAPGCASTTECSQCRGLSGP